MRSSGGVNAEIAEPMPFIRKLAVATVRAEADRFDDNVVPSAGGLIDALRGKQPANGDQQKQPSPMDAINSIFRKKKDGK